MAEWNYKSFWDESLSQLKKELGDEEYGIWFNKLEYIRAEEANIYGSKQRPMKALWVRAELRQKCDYYLCRCSPSILYNQFLSFPISCCKSSIRSSPTA